MKCRFDQNTKIIGCVNIKKEHTSFNKYKILDDYAVIYIKRKNGDDYKVKVDIEDIKRLVEHGYTWFVSWDENNKSWYARQSVAYKKPDGSYSCKINYMHRWLMGVTNSEEHVDHKNHDTLDNRKNNLRVTIARKNSAHRKGANSNNKTGVRNVHLITGYKGRQYYRVQIMKNGERYIWDFDLNQFDEACKFAEEKRKELFGEFAGNG